jgi:hypothetical protein
MLVLLLASKHLMWLELTLAKGSKHSLIEASLSGSVMSIKYHTASAIFMKREEVMCQGMREECHHYDTMLTRSQFSILTNVRWHSLLRLMINHKRPHFVFAHGPQISGDGPGLTAGYFVASVIMNYVYLTWRRDAVKLLNCLLKCTSMIVYDIC